MHLWNRSASSGKLPYGRLRRWHKWQNGANVYVRIAVKTQVRIKNGELHRQRANKTHLDVRQEIWECILDVYCGRIRRRATSAEDECGAVCVCAISG